MTSTYSHATDAFRCDECGEPMAIPLSCDHCGANYPERRAMGPFSVLGLEARWDLPEELFETRETTLAQRLHPDRWQGKGERQHKRALIAWSAVNEALEKTRDPFARAETLLEATHEWDDALSGKTTLPQAFLIEQLELQEEIQDGVDRDRKKALNKTIRHELKELVRQLAGHFEVIEATEHAGSAAGDARLAALKGAKAVVDRSRYWRNARRALRGDAQG